MPMGTFVLFLVATRPVAVSPTRQPTRSVKTTALSGACQPCRYSDAQRNFMRANPEERINIRCRGK
jgi:hypothetical protein